MKHTALVLLASLGLVLISDPTYAQTPPAAPAPAAPAAAAPDETAAPQDEKGQIKEIRATCRDEIKGQGLKGEDRMKAVSACVVKQRPDLAKREQCRMDGWAKGIRKHELQGYVKDCIEAKG